VSVEFFNNSWLTFIQTRHPKNQKNPYISYAHFGINVAFTYYMKNSIQKTLNQGIKKATGLAIMVATLSACGNVPGTGTAQQGNTGNQTGSTVTTNGCGNGAPNINALSLATQSLANSYIACKSGSAINIYSADQSQKRVAIFPALMGSNGVPQLWKNSSNQIVGSITTVSASGASVSYNGINFDSLYVIPEAQAQLFMGCVQNGQNLQLCGNGSLVVSVGRL
jgi:hypothetical protein